VAMLRANPIQLVENDELDETRYSTMQLVRLQVGAY
jgi:hypothetical protein